MGFKDILADDIHATFLNLDEFADEHTYADGKYRFKIKAVVDDDSLIAKYSSEFELLPKGSHLLYAAADEFPSKPLTGSVIRFDGDIYTIDEISEDVGMYEIFLSRGRT